MANKKNSISLQQQIEKCNICIEGEIAQLIFPGEYKPHKQKIRTHFKMQERKQTLIALPTTVS